MALDVALYQQLRRSGMSHDAAMDQADPDYLAEGEAPPEVDLTNIYTKEEADERFALSVPRASATYTTASLAAGASSTGTVGMSPGFRLLGVEASTPARVRLYVSTAARDADLARLITAEPTGNHGMHTEIVTTTEMPKVDMAPAVEGWVPAGDSVPITVENKDTEARAITVTINYMNSEV